MALIGMFSFACVALTLKRLTYLLPTPTILLYLFVVTSVFYAGHTVAKGMPLKMSQLSFLLIVLASFFAFIGNLCDVEALRLAPNAGYAAAVKSGQIVVITLVSYLLFKDQKLTLTGMLGVLMIFGGVCLLVIQK